MILRTIDFETTGLPPDASVCEAAYVDVQTDPAGTMESWRSLVKPTTEMSLEALATHHITEAEANADGMDWESASSLLNDGTAYAFVAHNAEFEKAFFNPAGSFWIDTWKVALRLWPESPSHSNQVMRYFLNLPVGFEAMPPHRALPDAWVTAHLLLEALNKASVEELIQWSDEPAFLTKISFGKHRGKLFSELPRDYLEWIVRQDMEPAVLAAAGRALAQ